MEVAELLALKYPFGREHEASTQLLFRSFCNNLFVGQFECARASIKELHDQRSFLRYPVKGILHQALEQWCKSGNTLHPLTWPCFTEYKSIEENKTQVEEICKGLEFRILLAELCNECEADVLQEIYGLRSRQVTELSAQCQRYLNCSLVAFPALTISLLEFLPLDEIAFRFNNIVLDALEACLTTKNKESLCKLLSQARLDLATDGTKDRLEVIFRNILRSCQASQDEAAWLSLTEFDAAISSRADAELYSIAQSVRRDLDLGGAAAKLFSKWRNVAMDTVSGQTHFFDSIMAKVNKLIKEHAYVQLVTLLDMAEWRPLLPVIFHLAWRQCSNTEQSHQLITAFSRIDDLKLKAIIDKHQRIDVIEQSLNLASDKSRRPAEVSSGMFSVGNSRSVLHALLMCLDNLECWSHQKMVQTLTAKSAYALLKQTENDVSDNDSLSIKQQRDINLFNAFFIIESAMQALCKAADESSGVPLAQRYKDEVLPLLLTAKKLLADLRPLTLKLEVLEDLFSLLFSKGSDVKTQPKFAETELNDLHSHGVAGSDASEDDLYYSAREALTPYIPSRAKTPQLNGSSGLAKPAVRKLDMASRLSSGSDHSSAGNTAEDFLHSATVGFLANEFIVRDLLSMVKNALTDLTAARFEMSNNSELRAFEEELSPMTMTSVTELNFMSRSSQLQQRVSEAVWRYQLILQDSVSKDFGSSVLRSVGQNRFLDDEGYATYERIVCQSGSKRAPTAAKRSEASQESEHSSELLTYSSGTNALPNAIKSKRYRKRKSHQAAKAAPTKHGLISKMLASPVSLLNMCIKRQSYVQAGQVLKLFNLEDSVHSSIFHFSQSYKKFVHELTNGSRPRTSSSDKPSSLTSGVDLSAIRQAAANSLSTMDDSAKAEQLALSAVVPVVNCQEQQIAKFLGSTSPQADTAKAMVLLDLACVATGDPKLSQQLLNSAQKFLSFKSNDRKSTLSGVQVWLRQCIVISELVQSADQEKIRQLVIKGPGNLSMAQEHDDLSLRSCLLSDLLSLSPADVKERVQPLLDVASNVSTMERAVAAWNKTGKSERVMKTLPIKSLVQSLDKHYSGEGRQYLTDLYSQIKLLHKAITDNTSLPKGASPSHFSVVDDGPTMIIGKLMFDHQVEPSKLEWIAGELKQDLTHVIVRSCCPPVRCKPVKGKSLAPQDTLAQRAREKRFGYRRVLNADAANHKEVNDFNLSPLDTVRQCLGNILTQVNDALSAAGAKLLTSELAEELKASSDYGRFYAECRQLQSVDLGQLSTDGEKRAFFINTHNLISLHGVIETLAESDGRQYLEDSVSNALAFQLRASYMVGQLGICSIFELQQFLLKASSKVQQLVLPRALLSDLSMEHPWYRYTPEYNPLTVFILYNGSVNTLPLRCLTAQSVNNDISDAVTKYMRQAVVIQPHSHQIVVPDMLLEVRGEPGMETANPIPHYDHADVLLWILEYQPSKRWSELKLIMDKLEHQHDTCSLASKSTDEETDSVSTDVLASVHISPTYHRLGFSVDTQATLMQQLSTAEETDLDTLSAECQSSGDMNTSDTILRNAKLKISDVAIQYLREKSPVVAMLLDIIYEDMLLHGDNDEQSAHFNTETLHNHYINLHRYLEQYILPLCVCVSEEIKTLSQMASADLPSHIKAPILSHKSCKYLDGSARRCIDVLCRDDKFGVVVTLIDKLMGLSPSPPPEWQALRDYSLIQCASERVSSESLACIKALHCERLQAHITISCLHKSRWAVEKCLQILPLCERRLWDKGDNSLVAPLKIIIERMSAFHRIMLHAQAKQDMVIPGCSAKLVVILASDWHSVAELLLDHPSEVFHLLFDADEFLFAKKLADMQPNLDADLRLVIYKRYLVSTLDGTSSSGSGSSTDDVISVLETCLSQDVDWCYKLCVQVVLGVREAPSMLAVVQFMQHKMSGSLREKQRENVQLCHIGAQMLMCLDTPSQQQYKALIFSPLLIFEQLLMNAKVAWAEKVLPYLQKADGSTAVNQLDFTEDVHHLLVKYAEKAVDFPLLFVSSEEPAVRANGITPKTPLMKNVKSMAKIGSPSNASPLQKALLGSSLRKSTGFQQATGSRLTRITTAPGSLSTLASEPGSAGVVGSPTHLVSPLPERTKKRFMLPERAPTREEWVPDINAEKCMLCHLVTFSMFNRRHHCRRCGRVVCATCSSFTAPVGGRSVRVCDECYTSMFKSREALEQQDPHVRKLREKLSGALTSVASPVNTLQVQLPDINSSAPEWILSTKEDDNEEIRQDFFYDHAPSVSLCTAILKLYSNGIECGKHMLTFCEKLSRIIKPIRPEAINQEVDYNLVISMMKFLLLNAKLLFMKEHCTDGVSLCEAYSNRVDVLSLLLSAYYLNLPTVEELSKIDNVRRLRDKLLEDERPELALEISTKFGLETNVIWSAWGLSCLRKADYMAARAKFSKFMKSPMDRQSQTVAYSSVLTDIVNTLQGQAAQINGTYTQASIENALKALNSGIDVSKSVPVLAWNACQHDENLEHVQECLYYLNLYGNYQMIVTFYRTHGFWQKAVQYCLDKKCSSDVFLNCLFLPAVRDGDLPLLQDQLLLIDSSLQKWNSYLTAVCRHLSRGSQYHTLYQIQLFTKDFLRAAMTCIKTFYLFNAETYVDLGNRLSHLYKALEHYQSYLNPMKWDNVQRSRPAQHSRGAESSVRLTQPESDVMRRMTEVELQIEVTKLMVSRGSASQSAITLLGDKREIPTVASRVIPAGKSISDGFEIAFRIIQSYQLNYSQVYTRAAQGLAEAGSYTQVKHLVTCIQESGLYDPELLDRVVLTAIRVAAASEFPPSKEIESLMKLLRTDSSKIEAFILSGKLRNAYLLAIKSDSLELVMRIAEEAARHNQQAVKTICEKYIKQKQPQ